MPWYIWVLIGNLAFSAVWKITQVGKPRDPLEPWEAATAVVVTAIYLVLLINWGLSVS